MDDDCSNNACVETEHRPGKVGAHASQIVEAEKAEVGQRRTVDGDVDDAERGHVGQEVLPRVYNESSSSIDAAATETSRSQTRADNRRAIHADPNDKSNEMTLLLIIHKFVSVQMVEETRIERIKLQNYDWRYLRSRDEIFFVLKIALISYSRETLQRRRL